MINLKSGKVIWRYQPENGVALYNSIFTEKYAVWFTYDNEIHLLDPLNGKLVKKLSLSQKVDYHYFNGEKYILEKGINYYGKYGQRIFPAWYSNIIVDDQLFFMCFSERKKFPVGPKYCMARVNLKSGRVEFLEVPVNFRFSGQEKKLLWKKNLSTKIRNSRGLDVAHDKRSRRDGWNWNFNGSPIAVNKLIYFTTMNGICYCLKCDSADWDSRALLAINDLGPFSQTWTVNTPSYANGRLYHRTLRELICIEKEKAQ